MKRVDIHHHIFPASIGKAGLSAKVGWRTPAENLPWTPEISLKAMADMGIGTAVLSIPAGLPAGPVGQENKTAARQFNEYAAEICADHPGKFGFFACLPNLKDTEGAIAEVRYALDDLKAWGIAMSSSYGEAQDASYVGDDVFDPIWVELDRRAAVVFLHGAQIPSSTPYPHPFLGIPVTEVPNETFKAAAHLVVTGKKRRFTKVKVILAHLGGSTPFLAPRVAVLSKHMGCTLSHEEIIEDFKSFYFDLALSSHETTLTAMRAFVGDDRLLFGTDFPAVSTEMARWYTRNADSFFSEDRDALKRVMYENAQLLLPM
ncbi:amidohydrolase 2 [Trametes coccinea BRFM310]|uniref:Amidohydrolase 2 n=1 Tax=Trametes coccinea (strain BRFM310) TaxID=1353009 RepID=A0A1Y2IUB2_TRAC3|nr:amidohydrolase 2 [Trametes coccinea BRFM310]